MYEKPPFIVHVTDTFKFDHIFNKSLAKKQARKWFREYGTPVTIYRNHKLVARITA
jgi:hypothetical protein